MSDGESDLVIQREIKKSLERLRGRDYTVRERESAITENAIQESTEYQTVKVLNII